MAKLSEEPEAYKTLQTIFHSLILVSVGLTGSYGKLEGIRGALEDNDNKLDNDEDSVKNEF
jgi:hypothetical protein